jgi:hypothetical protein
MIRKHKLFWVAVTMTLPTAGWAIELTDYTTVDSFYQEAFVNGSLNLNSGNQDQTSYHGSVFGNYDITYSTLPLVWGIKVDGDLEVDRGKDEGSDSEEGYDFFVHGNGDKYFNPEGLFFGYGAADFGYRKAMGAEDADDPFLKIGGGVGYGRVINATPLAEVLRVMEELRKYGLLSKEPSDQTYLDMAAVVAREEEYKSKYGFEDYKMYWIDDLEKVLQKAGVLKNNTLGTVGIIKTQDVLINEPISIRKHGWMARGGAGFVISDYSGEDSDPSVDASFEYALPFSYELQLIEEAGYSTILSDDITHHITNNLSLTYEIADRIDWENVWSLDWIKPTEDNTDDIITNGLRSSFRYYISNLIDANVTLSLTSFEDNIDDNGNDDMETSLTFGLRYRLR